MGQSSELFIEDRETETPFEVISEGDWKEAWEKERLNEIQSLSALEIFEKGLTKSDIKVMAAAAVESVLNQGNPLLVAEAVSAMKQFCKEVEDNESFEQYTREEAGKYPKGFVSNSGAKIECCEVGTKYDFSKCGDVELEMLEQAFKSAEASLKERKEFLKKIPVSGLDVIVPYTGEGIKVYPPSKSSTSSYKITLAK